MNRPPDLTSSPNSPAHLLEQSRGFAKDLRDWRRHLHSNPELSFQEKQTAEFVGSVLGAMGFQKLRKLGGQGLVAEICTDHSNQWVALRADMDALPITEENAVSYASRVPGVMHACGHDAHTTMLLGAARLLAGLHAAGELQQNVRLIFQPAEEAQDEAGLSGGQHMIRDGVMEGVEAIFALHVSPSIPAGRVSFQPGLINASMDNFEIHIQGKSCHAAMPNLGCDAIVLAARLVQDIQSLVSREIDPQRTGVVTIGELHAGTAANILAGEAILRGTIRTFDEPTRELLVDGVTVRAKSLEGLGAVVRCEFSGGYPVGKNNVGLSNWLEEQVRASLGEQTIHPPIGPASGSEDFSFMSAQVPGCMFRIGVRAGASEPIRQLHTPTFDLDEACLPLGAAVLAAAAAIPRQD